MPPVRMPTGAGAAVDPRLRERVERLVAEIPVDEGGGSTALKALVAADLIVRHDLRRAVEIGVYRGRFLLPLALVMRTLGRGIAIGIDPYSADAAVQRDDHAVPLDLVAWPQQVDWGALHAAVCATAERWDLGDALQLVRARSADAAPDLEAGTIDLLHVDGNHDRDAVERDIALYLPKLRPGGFLVLDDCSWASIRPVHERLSREHRLLFQLYDAGPVLGAGGNDFAVFHVERPLS